MAALAKRSLTIAGHRTSLALEPEFWSSLESLARKRKMSLPQLVGEIDQNRRGRSLASALRVAALKSASAE